MPRKRKKSFALFAVGVVFETIASEEIGGRHALLARELHFCQFECPVGEGYEQMSVLSPKMSWLFFRETFQFAACIDF